MLHTHHLTKMKMNTFNDKLSAVSLVVENKVIGCDVIQPNLFFLSGNLGSLKVSKYYVLIVRLKTHSNSRYDTNPPQKIFRSAIHKAQHTK